MRASDADRDRVSDQLREALAEGRLTPEEHAERIELVYRAKTYAELAPILADLPGSGAAPRPAMAVRSDLPAPQAQSPSIVTIFGGAERKGRWLVEPQLNVLTVFGGVDLDFREAVLSQPEVTINVSCIMGGLSIKVPPGVRVVNSVSAIFGGVDVGGTDAVQPGAPVIRLTGFVMMGGVSVEQRLPRADLKDLSDQRRALREERRALRDQRHEHLRELRQARRASRRTRRDS
jgi:Domain of unknown function (DUF1707)/Cell wall-active antibiotics response 4TMS YvqF